MTAAAAPPLALFFSSYQVEDNPPYDEGDSTEQYVIDCVHFFLSIRLLYNVIPTQTSAVTAAQIASVHAHLPTV